MFRFGLEFRATTVTGHPSVDELGRPITAGRAAIIGPIRQEVLNGIRDATTFERLRDRLGAFPDEATMEDYEQAAEFFVLDRRPAPMPVGGLLIRASQAKGGAFAERRPANRQPDRQPALCESTRNRHARKAINIERLRVAQ